MSRAVPIRLADMVIDRIDLVRADICSLAADIIVNAANTQLTPGGAVGLALHRAAGPELAAECSTLPSCCPGDAAITRAYRLPAKYVIHAVGASWHGGTRCETEQLARTYRRCFSLAIEHEARTIAFPAISCGLYSFPAPLAATVAVRETVAALSAHDTIERVTFALFTDNVHAAFAEALAAARASAVS